VSDRPAVFDREGFEGDKKADAKRPPPAAEITPATRSKRPPATKSHHHRRRQDPHPSRARSASGPDATSPTGSAVAAGAICSTCVSGIVAFSADTSTHGEVRSGAREPSAGPPRTVARPAEHQVPIASSRCEIRKSPRLVVVEKGATKQRNVPGGRNRGVGGREGGGGAGGRVLSGRGGGWWGGGGVG